MNGKKLIDVLQEINPDEIVHIGAETGFFYVGKASDAINSIDDISKCFFAELKSKRDSCLNKLEENLKRIPNRNENSYDWIKRIKEYIELITKTYSSVENYNDNIKRFKRIKNRDVIEKYDRIQKDGVIIIISGTERGDYWDHEEYKKHNQDKGE